MRLPLTNNEEPASIDIKQLKRMVDIFLERGFTYFDTAYMYHNYMSEVALKEVLVKRHPRNSYTIATKLPTMFLKKEQDLERIFNEQLDKIGVDYFDYYLLHNLGVAHYELAKKFNAFAFIQQKKDEGKVKEIGFSFHDTADLLNEILTAHPEVDFVQLQVNYMDWENESIQSRKCYEVAKKHNKPVIVMEPIKGGTLAKVPKKVALMFKEYHQKMSVASWAVRFAASLENVKMVLSGMSNIQHVIDNTGYMKEFKPFNLDEDNIVKRAVAILDEAIAVPCTVCQYCVEECPKQIAIPRYFALYNAEKQALNQGFSTQRMYYSNLIKKYGKASDCIECKKCESSCPQHLEISKYLKDVADTLEA